MCLKTSCDVQANKLSHATCIILSKSDWLLHTIYHLYSCSSCPDLCEVTWYKTVHAALVPYTVYWYFIFFYYKFFWCRSRGRLHMVSFWPVNKYKFKGKNKKTCNESYLMEEMLECCKSVSIGTTLIQTMIITIRPSWNTKHRIWRLSCACYNSTSDLHGAKQPKPSPQDKEITSQLQHSYEGQHQNTQHTHDKHTADVLHGELQYVIIHC